MSSSSRTQCPLCERPVQHDELCGYFELRICPTCAAGELSPPQRLTDRTIQVTYNPSGYGYFYDLPLDSTDPEGALKRARTSQGSGSQSPPSRVRVRGTVAHAPDIRLKIQRRRWWAKWSRLSQVKTGDALFDQYVWIRGEANEATSALLKHPSVLNGLLESTVGGEVVIDRGEVTCERLRVELGDAVDTVRTMLVLLCYLHALAIDSSSRV